MPACTNMVLGHSELVSKSGQGGPLQSGLPLHAACWAEHSETWRALGQVVPAQKDAVQGRTWEEFFTVAMVVSAPAWPWMAQTKPLAVDATTAATLVPVRAAPPVGGTALDAGATISGVDSGRAFSSGSLRWFAPPTA